METPSIAAAAVLAISPQPPDLLLRREDYALLKMPVMVVTGTHDFSLPPGTGPEQRAEVFHALGSGKKRLAVFAEADHMSFAGWGRRSRALQPGLRALTTSFWDWSLRGGPEVEAPPGCSLSR